MSQHFGPITWPTEGSANERRYTGTFAMPPMTQAERDALRERFRAARGGAL